MKQRLFVSINLSDEVKDYLFDLQKELNLDSKIKWGAKKNLHITLKFLGYIEEENIDKIITILSKVEFNCFEFKLKSLGVFDKSRPRVLYVDIEPSEDVINLQSKIENILSKLFLVDRRFSAHITLGRIKLLKDKISFLGKLEGFKVKAVKESIRAFYLMRSELRKDGPIYNLVKEFRLKE